jgi:hypothetical protein
MRTSLVKVNYDPLQLSAALINQFHASDREIFKELEDLRLKTDEAFAWLLNFTVAFSFRHQKTIPKVFEGVKFAPEIYERFSLTIPGCGGPYGKDSDFSKLGSSAFGAVEGVPDELEDFAQALSSLGMSVLSLELSRSMLTKGQYDDFVNYLMLAHESLASWRLNLKGMADKKRIATANALKRHVDTYRLRDEVIEYWNANISPTLSNEKAANLLVPRFPLSHRKLKQYIAEAKRKGTSC